MSEQALAWAQQQIEATRTVVDQIGADPDRLDRAIAACPGWSVRDVIRHLGAVHRWVGYAVREGNPRAPAPDYPPDADLATWWGAGADELLEVLRGDPQTPAWTLAEPATVGFWRRRQAHEHAIHRWDLLTALDAPADIDPDLAADGVDEVVTVMWPRQVRLGRVNDPGHEIELVTDAPARRWVLGSAPQVASVSGDPATLDLALWHRLPASDERLRWSGDVELGQATLALAVAP